jgi:serpin B
VEQIPFLSRLNKNGEISIRRFNMKSLLLIFTALTLLLASACQVMPEVPDPKDIEDPSTFLSSGLQRELDPGVSTDELEQLAKDNTSFALAFYELIRGNDENLIFSPFSLSLALSMTLAGAETSTQQAMLEALQFSLDEDEIHPAVNALLLAIDASQSIEDDSEGGRFQLNIANSIWGQGGFDFEQRFLDTLAVNYGAGMYIVDFISDPESARLAINAWVEEETEEKILDLIPPNAITPLTRLVLANAIYFNGSWLYPFDQSATGSGPFTTLDGSEISVDMMKLFDERLLYLEGEDFQAVRLPYLSSDFAMTLIVPEMGAFEALEEALNTSFITDLSAMMGSERLNLEMPKFDFETTINANDALKALGMEEAFDPDLSDFKGIADVEDLHITDVLQKATITVDEEGTEAAAATAVIVGIESMPMDDPISLIVDRPFFFLIQHVPTGTILFMGRVLQP